MGTTRNSPARKIQLNTYQVQRHAREGHTSAESSQEALLWRSDTFPNFPLTNHPGSSMRLISDIMYPMLIPKGVHQDRNFLAWGPPGVRVCQWRSGNIASGLRDSRVPFRVGRPRK